MTLVFIKAKSVSGFPETHYNSIQSHLDHRLSPGWETNLSDTEKWQEECFLKPSGSSNSTHPSWATHIKRWFVRQWCTYFKSISARTLQWMSSDTPKRQRKLLSSFFFPWHTLPLFLCLQHQFIMPFYFLLWQKEIFKNITYNCKITRNEQSDKNV